MMGVVTSGSASAQAGLIGTVFQLADQVNVVVNSARNIYDGISYMIEAGGGEPPPPLPGDDREQQSIALERHQELLRGMERLQTQMLALEQRQIETRDAMYDVDQIQLYRAAFSTGTSSFQLVREYFETPVESRADLNPEILQQLIRVSEQASAQTVAPHDRLGVHYVAALNITSLALVNLRSIYAADPNALPPRFRSRMISAIGHLEATTQMALADDGVLARTAETERNSYRAQLAALSRRREVAQLISGERFREGAAQACFEVALRRDCRGAECGNWIDQVRNVGQERQRVTIGYRQTRYSFQLERSVAGEGFNMMKGLRPAEAAQTETTTERVEGCQRSSDPEGAWLEAAHVYNSAVLEASPSGTRASAALGGLALARATRENLADLRSRL